MPDTPGQPIFTLKQLASDLGLSATTVSLALNDRGKSFGLSDKTIARVKKHAAAVGYEPNPQARDLRRQRSGIVGVVFPHLRNDWAHNILEGMYEPLENAGLIPFIVNDRNSLKREGVEIASLLQRRVGGILCNPRAGNLAAYRQVLQRGVPLVFFGDTLSEIPRASYAAWHPDAVGLAIRHLVETGRKRIAFLGGHDNRLIARLRFEAYRQTLADAGCPPHDDWVLMPRHATPSDSEILSLFRRRQRRPDAVFALYNDRAIQTREVLEGHGLRVPDDVAIATLADSPLCGPRAYDLTVVTAPIQDEGRQAALILLDLLRDPATPPIHRLVPGGELTPRGSTRPTTH